VHREIYREAKDYLYTVVPFIIDIRKDGTFMCGRRLLEPVRGDGSSHLGLGNEQESRKKFIKNFDFPAVKNYSIHILVNIQNSDITGDWDEEVELYDIRGKSRLGISFCN
jgi:hypothetical protein